MLTAKIRECTDCGSLKEVLKHLDCTIAQYGRNHWLNISFDSCTVYSKSVAKTLHHYKRILTKKLFNPDYACGSDLATILSRVQTLLIRKDCCQLAEHCEFPTASTFDEVSS